MAEDATVRDSANGELQHNWPEPLPNGRGVLFVIDRAGPGVIVAATNDIAALNLATRKHRVLVRGVYAKYVKTGHLLYVTAGGVLMAVPFDQDRLDLAGTPVALREGITVRRGGGGVDLAVSETGTLWHGLGTNTFRLVAWASRSGEFTPVAPGWTGDFGSIALSPDGTRLADAARALHRRCDRRTDPGEEPGNSRWSAVQADVQRCQPGAAMASTGGSGALRCHVRPHGKHPGRSRELPPRFS